MRKLLWVGDAVCDSGFARCTHKTLETLRQTWDVSVLGINYRGDPHQYPYRIYPAYVVGGPRDLMGYSRIIDVMARERPDVVVLQNDPWNIPGYIEQIKRIRKPPVVVGAIAVDGKNCRGRDLNGLDHVILWTEFAREEALKGGCIRSTSVVPLGVDLGIYKPLDKREARAHLPAQTRDGFIVLNANRNQPRKRIDLTIRAFAQFFHTNKADAYLYLHICPTGDIGVDADQLAAYYNLKGRLLLESPGVYEALSEEDLAMTYQASDVQMSTTQGEGWGLTTMEGMACGIPQILPDWSALGEWAKPAALMVPCTGTTTTIGGVNAIGGVPDETAVVNALQSLYDSRSRREELSKRGLALVQQPQFRWENIGARFAEEVERAFITGTVTRHALREDDRREGDAGQPVRLAAGFPREVGERSTRKPR
jgi:D-inositol-3-phosphate glycosyltransferase